MAAPHRVRIIGGRHRGRQVPVVAAPGLRPTPDRVRETLFNWLGQDLSGATTLELYAGTGVLTLEALSRGAALSVAVDRNPALIRALAAIARASSASRPSRRTSTTRFAFIRAERRRFDVVFLDPPFAEDPWRDALRRDRRRAWRPVASSTPRRVDCSQAPPAFEIDPARAGGERALSSARADATGVANHEGRLPRHVRSVHPRPRGPGPPRRAAVRRGGRRASRTASRSGRSSRRTSASRWRAKSCAPFPNVEVLGFSSLLMEFVHDAGRAGDPARACAPCPTSSTSSRWPE